LYGDLDGNGAVNFADISLVVDVFRGIQTTIPPDILDVSAAVQSFQGNAPCPDACS
jgi:hypothetical protein